MTGTVAATSYTGDGSALTGISVGIATTAASMSEIKEPILINFSFSVVPDNSFLTNVSFNF